MGLINEEKIVEKAWTESTEISDRFENLGPLVSSIIGVEAGRSFSRGCAFGEFETKKLIIEFAEFVLWNNFGAEHKIDIQSNFEKFVEQLEK